MESGRIERTFTPPPGVAPTIEARIPSGTLQIHGEERADVAVTVTVEPADAIGRDLEIFLEEHGEAIRAEVRAVGRGDSLFGMGWLRKAILRAAGVIPLHDEDAIYASETAQLAGTNGGQRASLDWIAGLTAFKAVLLEGLAARC